MGIRARVKVNMMVSKEGAAYVSFTRVPLWASLHSLKCTGVCGLSTLVAETRMP